jgi:hypothetical protein
MFTKTINITQATLQQSFYDLKLPSCPQLYELSHQFIEHLKNNPGITHFKLEFDLFFIDGTVIKFSIRFLDFLPLNTLYPKIQIALLELLASCYTYSPTPEDTLFSNFVLVFPDESSSFKIICTKGGLVADVVDNLKDLSIQTISIRFIPLDLE